MDGVWSVCVHVGKAVLWEVAAWRCVQGLCGGILAVLGGSQFEELALLVHFARSQGLVSAQVVEILHVVPAA